MILLECLSWSDSFLICKVFKLIDIDVGNVIGGCLWPESDLSDDGGCCGLINDRSNSLGNGLGNKISVASLSSVPERGDANLVRSLPGSGIDQEALVSFSSLKTRPPVGFNLCSPSFEQLLFLIRSRKRLLSLNC